MKTKTLLSILALSITISTYSQKPTLELTFTAENNGQYVPLDSILIENLTQGSDTTLYAPDTLLVLDYVTNIGKIETIEENTFTVSQNYPNPFNGKTAINLNLPEKDDIKITVRDFLGRELAHYENTLKQGNHSFTFYSAKEKYYLLIVTGMQSSQTIRMLNAGNHRTNGEKCKMVYTGYNRNVTGYKSQKAINDFGFNIGDELKYTAYTDIEEIEIIDFPTGNQSYTFQFDGWTPCPGSSIVIDFDGNTYNTVQIGDQCWMKENLKATIYSNGTSIPNVANDLEWNNLTSGAYVWYDNDVTWKDYYGALYNWYATIDDNGLCPLGWQVPTIDEWTELTDYIGGTGSPHGNELKSCRQVDSPLGGACNISEHPRWNQHNINYGSDNYNFSGLPGGYRYFEFSGIGGHSGCWSSSEANDVGSYSRDLRYNHGNVAEGEFLKISGFSVRCLRD